MDAKTLRLVIAATLLTTILSVGLWIISYCRRKMIVEPYDDLDMLAQIEAAHEEGELDDFEFQKVRNLLMERTNGPAKGKEDPLRKYANALRSAQLGEAAKPSEGSRIGGDDDPA